MLNRYGSSESSFAETGLMKESNNTPRNTQPSECFQVQIKGSVESGQYFGESKLVCMYEVVVGADWSNSNGSEDGETQLAKNSVISEDLPTVSWNFPIDVTFRSTNVCGWPRVSLTLRNGNRDIVGYGSCYVPTRNGTFVRYCKLFKPLSSSHMGGLLATISGDLPEFFDGRFTTANVGRESTRVESAGVVKIVLSVRIDTGRLQGYEFQ